MRSLIRVSIPMVLLAALLPGGSARATFAGDNGHIYFIQPGTGTAIESVTPDGQPGGSVECEGSATVDPLSTMSFDSSGLLLALTCVTGGNKDIVIADFDHGSFNYPTMTSAAEYDPAFSTGGQLFAYIKGTGASSQLCTYAFESGSECFPADLPGGTKSGPNWDPSTGDFDGSFIFTSDADGDNDLYVINVADQNVEQLTGVADAETASDFAPNYSPDGSMVAFTSDRGGSLQVYVAPSDDLASAEVATGADGTMNVDPAWSPDGTMLLYEKIDSVAGTLRLWTQNLATGAETLLGGQTHDAHMPEWQPLGGGCESCYEPYEPTLKLQLKGHLKAIAGAASPDGGYGGGCGYGLPMTIQKKKGTKWIAVASGSTNNDGKFIKKLPDKPGKYRVVSESHQDDNAFLDCQPAVSGAKAHKH